MQTQLEWVLTHNFKEGMIDYIRSNPLEIDNLIILIFELRQPYSWRAAWLLWSCMEENDIRVANYIGKFVEGLTFYPDNMKKDICMILLKMDIEENLEGILFDHCIGIWEDISKKPAIRANAMRILIKLTEKYPDLYHEVISLTNDIYLQDSSTGLKHSIKKRISALNGKMQNNSKII